MTLPDNSRQVAGPLVVLAVGIALLNGSLGVYVVPFQIGVWIDLTGLSASRSGALGMLEIGLMSITSIVLASRMPDWPHMRIAVFGAVVAVGGQLVAAYTDAFPVLVVSRFLVGIGSGLIFAAVVAAMAVVEEPERLMGFGQSLMNLLFMGMFALIPFVLAWQAQQGLFLVLAGVMAMSILAYRFFPVRPGPIARNDSRGQYRAGTGRVFIHFSGIVLLNVGLGALWGFLERIGADIGLSAYEIGTVLSVSTLAMIAGSALAGWLGARKGRALPMLAASLLCSCAALGVMLANSIEMYAAAVFLYGGAYLFLGPYIIVGVSSALDPEGRLAPACGGAMFLSYAVGIGGGGLVADTFSYTTIGWFALVGCAISGGLFYFNARSLESGQFV